MFHLAPLRWEVVFCFLGMTRSKPAHWTLSAEIVKSSQLVDCPKLMNTLKLS